MYDHHQEAVAVAVVSETAVCLMSSSLRTIYLWAEGADDVFRVSLLGGYTSGGKLNFYLQKPDSWNAGSLSLLAATAAGSVILCLMDVRVTNVERSLAV